MATFSKEELLRFWLLTSAIDHSVSLRGFFPKFEWGPLNMRDLPGCSPTDYARELLVLFDNEWIEFEPTKSVDDLSTRSGVIQILDRFLRFSEQNPDATLHRWPTRPGNDLRYIHRPDLRADFRLSMKGGDAWEKVAQPDWNRFFDQRSDYESGELYSQNLTLLMARLGWWRELDDTKVDINTIDLHTLPEFQVLYWKTLPNVHRATFSLARAESRWTNGVEPKWFREWWHSTTKWFTHPWELPDWPSSTGN